MRTIIKKIIPKVFIQKAKKIKTDLDFHFSNFMSKNKYLSGVYYMLFDSSFLREHQSVLAGKVSYYKTIKRKEKPVYLLRRNIHRIEKGLIMIPRRSTFALDYIEETLLAYKQYINESETLDNDAEYFWFTDVFDEYFKTSDSEHPIIKKNKMRFEAHKLEVKNNISNKRKPFKRTVNTSLSYDDLLQLSKQRRSVRWFKQQKVDRTLLDKAFLVANQAPSACNRQPFEFLVFDDPAMVKKICDCSIGVGGYKENIPGIMVIKGNLDAYFSERDRHIIYIDGSLASMSLMFALETLGLSSCSINWPDIEDNEKQLAQILGLQKFERPIMLLAYGYPNNEALVPYSEKQSLNNLRRYDYTN